MTNPSLSSLYWSKSSKVLGPSAQSLSAKLVMLVTLISWKVIFSTFLRKGNTSCHLCIKRPKYQPAKEISSPILLPLNWKPCWVQHHTIFLRILQIHWGKSKTYQHPCPLQRGIWLQCSHRHCLLDQKVSIHISVSPAPDKKKIPKFFGTFFIILDQWV